MNADLLPILNDTDVFLILFFLDLAKISLCQDLRLDYRPTEYVVGLSKLYIFAQNHSNMHA